MIQLSCSLIWHLTLKMQIVWINPASIMKLHPGWFCSMIYQSRFSTRWLTQLLLCPHDVEANPGLSQVCVNATTRTHTSNTIQATPLNNKSSKTDKNIHFAQINGISNKHEELNQLTHYTTQHHHRTRDKTDNYIQDTEHSKLHTELKS